MALTAAAAKDRNVPLTAAVSFFGSVIDDTEHFDDIDVPSTSASSEYHDDSGSSSSSSLDLLKDSASHSAAFPILPGATLLARILDAGHTLELRWLQQTLQRRGTQQDEEDGRSDLSELPVRLRFAGEIIPTIAAVISTDASSASHERLEITLLTARPFIVYHLSFDGPDFFHSTSPLPKSWCLEQAITLPALLPSTDTISFVAPLASAGSGSSSQGLAVATRNGTIACLEWLSDERRFQESELRSEQSFGSALRSWVMPSRFASTVMSPTRYSSTARSDASSNPESVVSMTTDEEGMLPDCIFTLHRDRKLKAWSIATKSCLTIAAVPAEPQTMDIIPSSDISASTGGDARSTLLLGPQPRPLMRLFRSSKANTQPFLLLYSPSANVQTSFFVVFALNLDNDGNLRSLSAVREIPCNFPLPSHAGQTGAYSTSLTDFSVVHDASSPTLWTMWNESGTAVLRYLKIDNLDFHMEDASSTASWNAISPPAAFSTDSLDSVAADFDAAVAHQLDMVDVQHGEHEQHARQHTPYEVILACKRGVAQSVLRHLFSSPPKFATNGIWASLLSYAESLSDQETLTSVHIGRQNGDSPAQIALDIVGCSVEVRHDTETGALQVEQYVKDVRAEWLRFTAICEEVRRSVITPASLAVLPPVQPEGVTCVLGLTRGAAMTPLQTDFAETLIGRSAGDLNVDVLRDLTGNTDVQANDLATLVDACSQLSAHIEQGESAATLADLEEAIIDRLSNQPHELQSEIAAQLYEEHLESIMSDDFVSELTARLSSLTAETFESSMTTALKLLCAGTPSQGQSAEPASKLFAALITDAASKGILERFKLALQLLALLLVAQGELVNSDPSIDVQEALTISEDVIERWLEHAFCALRRLGIAKRLCDINAAMTDLQYASEALEYTGRQVRHSHPHAGSSMSVAQVLSMTPAYTPSLRAGRTYSSVTNLWLRIGLLSDSDHLDDAQLTAAASRIVFSLQDQGFTSEAHEILSLLPQQDEDAALLHLQGLISLQQEEWHAASLAFERVAASICEVSCTCCLPATN